MIYGDAHISNPITILWLSEGCREWRGDIVVRTFFTDNIHGYKMLHCPCYTPLVSINVNGAYCSVELTDQDWICLRFRGQLCGSQPGIFFLRKLVE